MTNYTDQQLAELEKSLEAELKQMEGPANDYGTPEAPSKDSPYKFLREIINSKDSRKTGNVSSNELGKPKMGIRPTLKIARYAKAEGLDHVASYLQDLAEVDLSTSSSKDGFLSKLFVTQIRKTGDERSSRPADESVWSKVFGKKKSDNPMEV